MTPFRVECWAEWRDRLRPQIERMAGGSGGRYDADDIDAEISSGSMQVWLACENEAVACVLVTQFIPYPRFSALRCIGVVGHASNRWRHLMTWLEDQARSLGCARMEALHPVGYDRLLATGGWCIFHVLSEKVLTCEG